MKVPFNRFNAFYESHKSMIIDSIDKVLMSGKYIRDVNIIKLEAEIANTCKRNYAVSTSSCTDALFFALKAAGVKEGDEVIVSDFSYIASLSPILMCGAIPVFADIDPGTLTLNQEKIEELITKKTRAIIFVQLFGISIDLSTVKNLAKKHGLVLIEDAAQALGSEVCNIQGGGQGDISCLSFDPTKIISAFGTGGMLLTDNKDFFDTTTKLVHHGKNSNNDFEILGYNSKIPETNALLLNLQLAELKEIVADHNRIAKRYINQLNQIEQVTAIKADDSQISTFHKFIIRVVKRDELRSYLTEHGIETRIHYDVLLHEQKLLKDYPFIKHSTVNAENARTKVLSLPVFYGLKDSDIDYICECINNFYKK